MIFTFKVRKDRKIVETITVNAMTLEEVEYQVIQDAEFVHGLCTVELDDFNLSIDEFHLYN